MTNQTRALAKRLGLMSERLVQTKPRAITRSDLDGIIAALRDAEKMLVDGPFGAAEQRGEARGPQWQPIETCPRDGTVVLRPHTIWGAMDVAYRPDANADSPWINGDYSLCWPEHVLWPLWMPLPEVSEAEKERFRAAHLPSPPPGESACKHERRTMVKGHPETLTCDDCNARLVPGESVEPS